MKFKDRAARFAVTAGLAAAMTLGGVAPALSAFATETSSSDTSAASTTDATTSASGTGDVTISKRADGDATTIYGYQIFTADVVDQTVGATTQKVASNIDWASTDVQSLVVAAIQQVDSSYTSTTAQAAADWLSAHQSGSGTDVVVNSSDAFGLIAKALRGSSITPTTITPGTTATGLPAGYWLFVTSEASTTDTSDSALVDQVGTAPIYAIVGGSALTISQKTNLPTVDKQVLNDKDGSAWGKYADSQVGQSVQYKITGTVVDTIDSYDTYYYKFTDNLGSGLTADSTSVKVTITDGSTETTVTPSATSLLTNSDGTSTLTVEFTDLKQAAKEAGVALDASSIVTVYYTAQLNSKALVAGAVNQNDVYLTYSNNPGTESHGDTTPSHAYDYTYELMLYKVDSSDSTKALSDAKFTIQATGPDEGGTGTQYVQSDGTLGDTAYEFTTDSKGGIYVTGLDAGTYTVVETQAPDGYNKVAPFTFSITPVFGGTDGSLSKLAVGTSDSNIATANEYNGVVQVTVKDKAGSTLPLTGQAGITVAWVAGGVLLTVGVVHLVRSRRRGESQE